MILTPKTIQFKYFKILDLRVFESLKLQNTWKRAFHGWECEGFGSTFFKIFSWLGYFFLYCSTNGCFWDMLGLEDLSAISWTKNSHFWANNGQNDKKCCFSLKNGYFWPKKWQTGLITLAYQKSTHLCYNFKKLAQLGKI